MHDWRRFINSLMPAECKPPATEKVSIAEPPLPDWFRNRFEVPGVPDDFSRHTFEFVHCKWGCKVRGNKPKRWSGRWRRGRREGGRHTGGPVDKNAWRRDLPECSYVLETRPHCHHYFFVAWPWSVDQLNNLKLKVLILQITLESTRHDMSLQNVVVNSRRHNRNA